MRLCLWGYETTKNMPHILALVVLHISISCDECLQPCVAMELTGSWTMRLLMRTMRFGGKWSSCSQLVSSQQNLSWSWATSGPSQFLQDNKHLTIWRTSTRFNWNKLFMKNKPTPQANQNLHEEQTDTSTQPNSSWRTNPHLNQTKIFMKNKHTPQQVLAMGTHCHAITQAAKFQMGTGNKGAEEKLTEGEQADHVTHDRKPRWNTLTLVLLYSNCSTVVHGFRALPVQSHLHTPAGVYLLNRTSRGLAHALCGCFRPENNYRL